MVLLCILREEKQRFVHKSKQPFRLFEVIQGYGDLVTRVNFDTRCE